MDLGSLDWSPCVQPNHQGVTSTWDSEVALDTQRGLGGFLLSGAFGTEMR